MNNEVTLQMTEQFEVVIEAEDEQDAAQTVRRA